MFKDRNNIFVFKLNFKGMIGVHNHLRYINFENLVEPQLHDWTGSILMA